MADNIIGNMFGVDPDQLQAQRMQNAYNQSIQMAQLDPFQRASAGIMQGAAGATMLGAKALGMKTREEQLSETRQSALQGLNADNPQSIMDAAQKLNQAGDTRGAMMLTQHARDVEKAKVEEAFKQQQTSYMAKREKELDEEKRKTTIVEVPVEGNKIQKYQTNPDGTVNYDKPVGVSYMNPEYLKATKQGSEKPLPASVYKLKGDWEDSLNTASQIEQDSKAWAEKIKSGKLNLGLLDNLAGKLSVKAGVSGAEAVEVAEFANYIEKLRNDRLLLAKGTQTEGDAARALTEIVTSISDNKYVARRLETLGKQASGKIDLNKRQLGSMYKRYGIEESPEDYMVKNSPYAMKKEETVQKPVASKKVVKWEDLP